MNKWIIAMGASGASGLKDLCVILSDLPINLNAAVLIVLHRSWDEPSHLRDVLSRHSKLPVVIAGQGDKIERGVVYIGEPSIHLTLLERSFALLTDDRERVHGNRTIDLLFHSIALCGGHNTIGVILSGSLDDGSRGLAAIHQAGGKTMVLGHQGLPDSGMPRNAFLFDGPVSVAASAPMLAKAIVRLVTSK
ncbi:chemotaxis protein CheB [Pseudomonas atacamensis]|uniref:protein-glutamate methylesterase n=1 Tax=Pseudomonas atacamensis TaxID=2565368 RepID=A0AAQ2HYC2_9PSED|nr:chemotaxis protein CheB [Pseudomonas atacamensis]THF25814.1 chemotaxis protein CheB [Pseudomonas atacamensis]